MEDEDIRIDLTSEDNPYESTSKDNPHESTSKDNPIDLSSDDDDSICEIHPFDLNSEENELAAAVDKKLDTFFTSVRPKPIIHIKASDCIAEYGEFLDDVLSSPPPLQPALIFLLWPVYVHFCLHLLDCEEEELFSDLLTCSNTFRDPIFFNIYDKELDFLLKVTDYNDLHGTKFFKKWRIHRYIIHLTELSYIYFSEDILPGKIAVPQILARYSHIRLVKEMHTPEERLSIDWHVNDYLLKCSMVKFYYDQHNAKEERKLWPLAATAPELKGYLMADYCTENLDKTTIWPTSRSLRQAETYAVRDGLLTVDTQIRIFQQASSFLRKRKLPIPHVQCLTIPLTPKASNPVKGCFTPNGAAAIGYEDGSIFVQLSINQDITETDLWRCFDGDRNMLKKYKIGGKSSAKLKQETPFLDKKKIIVVKNGAKSKLTTESRTAEDQTKRPLEYEEGSVTYRAISGRIPFKTVMLSKLFSCDTCSPHELREVLTESGLTKEELEDEIEKLWADEALSEQRKLEMAFETLFLQDPNSEKLSASEQGEEESEPMQVETRVCPSDIPEEEPDPEEEAKKAKAKAQHKAAHAAKASSSKTTIDPTKADSDPDVQMRFSVADKEILELMKLTGMQRSQIVTRMLRRPKPKKDKPEDDGFEDICEPVTKESVVSRKRKKNNPKKKKRRTRERRSDYPILRLQELSEAQMVEGIEHFENCIDHSATLKAIAHKTQQEIFDSEDMTLNVNDMKCVVPPRMNVKIIKEDSYVFQGHGGAITGLTYSKKANLLLSASVDGDVKAWDFNTGLCKSKYVGHEYPILDIQMSPDDYFFATGSVDNSARLWCLSRTTPLRVFIGHFSYVEKLAFHPSCSYLGTSCCDGYLRLFALSDARQVRVFPSVRPLPVYAMTFTNNGFYMIHGGEETDIRVHDIRMQKQLFQFEGHQHPVTALQPSPCGGYLFSGDAGGVVKIWNMNVPASDKSSECFFPPLGSMNVNEDVPYKIAGFTVDKKLGVITAIRLGSQKPK